MIYSVHPPVLLAVNFYSVWVIGGLHAGMMILGPWPHIYPQHTTVSTGWPTSPHSLVRNAPARVMPGSALYVCLLKP